MKCKNCGHLIVMVGADCWRHYRASDGYSALICPVKARGFGKGIVCGCTNPEPEKEVGKE